MRANWQKWSDDRIGIELAGTPDELRRLAGALVELSRDREQHFHITETGKGSTRVGDIEIRVLPDAGDESLAVYSFALAPGTEIPDSPSAIHGAPTRKSPNIRSIGAALLLFGAAFAILNAYASQYITVAGSDYRPILTQGAQAGCIALVLLQAAALTARGWKLKLVALLGSVVVADAVLGVVARLTGLPRHM